MGSEMCIRDRLREEGWSVEEEEIPLSTLADADEIWITSSIRDISRVTCLEPSPSVSLASGEVLPEVVLQRRDLEDSAVQRGIEAQAIFARRAAEDLNP